MAQLVGVFPSEGMELTLLDRFALHVAGEAVAVPFHSATVLAYIALSGRPIHRSIVASVLWPRAAEARATANLRTALYRIPFAARVIRSVGPTLELSSEVRVDLREAAGLSRQMIRSSAVPEPLEGVIRRLQGELLPDWEAVWIEPERERFRQLRLHALEALASTLSACGRHAEAIEAAQTALMVEPASERAERALLHSFAAEGNPALALREYESFRRRLWRELRVRPSADLEQLGLQLGRKGGVSPSVMPR